MLKSVCWSVMTWTTSCFITRAQWNGLGLVRVLASATTLPVQAPTVGMKGKATVRPLNFSWSFMISICVRPGGS